MKSARSEEFVEKMKSVVAVVAVCAVATVIAINNPKYMQSMRANQGVAPGTVAPQIIGTDVDGNPMKLSDYRGKVVMLDFFGNW